MRATISGVPLADDPAPFVGGAGPQIDDVIGSLHQLQIVLDDDQRMADGQQGVETIEQLHDVGKCRPVVGSSSRNSDRDRLVPDM